MTFYSTPFGTLQMGIAATGLELQEEEDNIHLKVDYALDMNEEHVADCYLSGTAAEARRNNRQPYCSWPADGRRFGVC